MRKSIVTEIRDKDLGNFDEVAQNMSHSIKTAETHQYLRNKQKFAAIAGDTIRKLYLEASLEEDPQRSKSTTPRKKIWKENETSISMETFDIDDIHSPSSVRDICVKENLKQRVAASPKQIFDKLHSIRRYSPEKRVSFYLKYISIILLVTLQFQTLIVPDNIHMNSNIFLGSIKIINY